MQPSSLDVRVDRYFRVFRNSRYPFIDVKAQQEELTELVEVVDDEAFILHPGEFVLGSTLERVTLPDDLVARLEGKSSLGRLGLLIHSTAGFIDPGWDGHVTLELSNVANLPITIYPEMKIGQLSFVQLSEPAERPYGTEGIGSKYQGQRGPTPSRYWQNFARSLSYAAGSQPAGVALGETRASSALSSPSSSSSKRAAKNASTWARWLRTPRELRQADVGQHRIDHATVGGTGAALDETAALETVQQSGHARRCQQHLLRQVDASHLSIRRTGQAKQHLVVRDREPVIRRQLGIQLPRHGRVCAQQSHERSATPKDCSLNT